MLLRAKSETAEEIFALIETIKHLFSTTDANWTVSGISNGGKATFLFVAANPKLFETVFTFPGGLFDVVPTNEWGHLKIVLANGKKDGYGWLQESKKSFEILLPIAKKVKGSTLGWYVNRRWVSYNQLRNAIRSFKRNND